MKLARQRNKYDIFKKNSSPSWLQSIFKKPTTPTKSSIVQSYTVNKIPEFTYKEVKGQHKSGKIDDTKNLIMITSKDMSSVIKCDIVTEWLRHLGIIGLDNKVVDLAVISDFIPKPEQRYFYIITLSKKLTVVPIEYDYIQTPLEFLDIDSGFKFKSKK